MLLTISSLDNLSECQLDAVLKLLPTSQHWDWPTWKPVSLLTLSFSAVDCERSSSVPGLKLA